MRKIDIIIFNLVSEPEIEKSRKKLELRVNDGYVVDESFTIESCIVLFLSKDEVNGKN